MTPTVAPELVDLLVCPACGAKASEAVTFGSLRCQRCNTQFFELDGLPCWFANGLAERDYWSHLLAVLKLELEQIDSLHEAQLSFPNLLQSTRERLLISYEERSSTYKTLISLLENSGLEAKAQKEYQHCDTQMFTQYYGTMLRDWAWSSYQKDKQNPQDENQVVFQGILDTIKSNEACQDVLKSKKILVIGSGAGWLSWALHREIDPALTIALDFNPILNLLAKNLINDKEILQFKEAHSAPHHGLAKIENWQLSCTDGDDEQRSRWHAFCADAWHLPFAEQSFDLVITPWFLDVCCRDIKDLIPTIENMLQPSGIWLNYGPFLYGSEVMESQAYSAEELRQLLAYAKFEILGENFFCPPYANSPLNPKTKTEETWCFIAKSADDSEHLKSAGTQTKNLTASDEPGWLVLPHIPVPRFEQLGEIENSTAKQVFRLVNGQRSINDIAATLQPMLPQDLNAYEFVYSLLKEYVLTD